MFVLNRDGQKKRFTSQRIIDDLTRFSMPSPLHHWSGLSSTIQPEAIYMQFSKQNQYEPMMKTTDILQRLIMLLVQQGAEHPDYYTLAGRLDMWRLHESTPRSFLEAMERSGAVQTDKLKWIKDHQSELEALVGDCGDDFRFDYLGLEQLKSKYLFREASTGMVIERPTHMFLRAAIQVFWSEITRSSSSSSSWFEDVKRLHGQLCRHEVCLATPILLNACRPDAGLASCFLLSNAEDSLEGMYNQIIPAIVQISKRSGGIGLSLGSIRGKGRPISTTGGKTSGVKKFVSSIQSAVRHIDQGGGRRKGSCMIAMPIFHSDALDVFQMKLPHAAEEERAEDLFYSVMLPDLFLRRVQEGGSWSFFSPDNAPGLDDCYGSDFERLYEAYEKDPKRIASTLPAVTVWNHLASILFQVGTPYMIFRDDVNQRTNQKNIGVIRNTNLCAEIMQVSDFQMRSNTSTVEEKETKGPSTSSDKDAVHSEIAVCNLASISLPSCAVWKESAKRYEMDYEKLAQLTASLTVALNGLIDSNHYPTPACKVSNSRHRPIGIGIQGLYDLTNLLDIPFDSDEAVRLNARIAEVMYHSFLSESCRLVESGRYRPYDSFQGSDLSKGIFHWEYTPNLKLSGLVNWERLRERVIKHGVCNSLGIALMPTASTSTLLGNTESFEAPMGLMMDRVTDVGSFLVVNKHLVRKLESLGIAWDERIRSAITLSRGRIHLIRSIPASVRELFPTVWDIHPKRALELAGARAPFVDQSQSLNAYIAIPTELSHTLTDEERKEFRDQWMFRYLMEARRLGVKTGSYYTRQLVESSNSNYSTNLDEAQQFLTDAQVELQHLKQGRWYSPSTSTPTDREENKQQNVSVTQPIPRSTTTSNIQLSEADLQLLSAFKQSKQSKQAHAKAEDVCEACSA